MCGRFGQAYPRMSLKDGYRAAAMPEFDPRYNIAPTMNIVVIRDGKEGRTGSMMRWGLIPWWFKGPDKLPLLHNARSETVHEKKLFKASFHRQRCIIPASGFFEWQKMPSGRKQPFYISSRDGKPLSFAGIWDSALMGEGESVESCAILTTDCNALMQPIHDRMPVVLGVHDWDTWLNPLPQPDEVLMNLLKPFAPDLMQLWAVSSAVGRVNNQGEELIRPVSLSGLI